MNNQTELEKRFDKIIFFITTCSFLFILFLNFVFAGNPVSPDSLTVMTNETNNNSASSGTIVNISGAYLATLNLTATSQNLKWKAFVGYITGSFTLNDQSGSKIYDWSLTTISGEVYATRNSSAISWASIRCANVTTSEAENSALSHTNSQDNITKTFNAYSAGTHPEFFVGTVNISVNSCPALYTYVNDTAQSSHFPEVALYAAGSMVYSTLIENRYTGFDNSSYDFQLIVPERGSTGFSGSTPYYFYTEIS